jgi:hypothetical protein
MFYHSTYLALPTYINIRDNVEREEMILQNQQGMVRIAFTLQ